MATLAGLKPTTRNLQDLHKGEAKAVVRKLKQRGRAPWLELELSEDLGKLAEKLKTKAKARKLLEQQDGNVSVELELACQTCDARRILRDRCPINNGKWRLMLCRECNTTRTLNKWHCSCGTPWHTCSEHAQVGFSVRTRQSTSLRLKRRTTGKMHKLPPLGQQQKARKPHASHKRCTTTTKTTEHGPMHNANTDISNLQPVVHEQRHHHHKRRRLEETTKLGSQQTLFKSIQYLQHYLATGVVQQTGLARKKAVAAGDASEPKVRKGKSSQLKLACQRQLQTERLFQRFRPSLSERTNQSTDTAGVGGGHPTPKYVDGILIGLQGQQTAGNITPSIDISGSKFSLA